MRDTTTEPTGVQLPPDAATLRALYSSALALTEGLDLEPALERIVAAAREITGARYAACGVPREDGRLQHFIYRGVDEAGARAIGRLPEGRGLIGAMLHRSTPLRLVNMAGAPGTAGFPPHHPVMTSFLGVPILARGRNLGVIYLSDKENGEPFTAEDEGAVVALAAFAATAIGNAYQYLQVNAELERRRAELDVTSRTLRALSNRMLWMMESESRELAQELHDELGQVLAAAVIQADAIVEGRVAAAEGAMKLRALLRDAVRDVRRISQGLRPSMLDELGPVAALRAVVEQMDALKRGRVTFHTVGAARRLPEPVETVIYRVGQEALTNAVRHSGASHIEMTLAFEPAEARLVISDNGIGMPVDGIPPGHGLGLAGMRERAMLVSGSLRIASKPGQGVRVELTVPAG